MRKLLLLLATASASMTGAAAAPPALIYAGNYGAQCDGSNDDTAAINSAIAAAIHAGGVIVQLPAGFCLTSAPLKINRGVILQGSGIGVASGVGNSGGTVLRSTKPFGDVISITAEGGVIVRDFAIDAPGVIKSGDSAGIRIAGPSGAGSINNHSRLENLLIFNMENGIVLDAASNLVISRCHIQDYRVRGIDIRQTNATDYGQNTIESSVIWDLNVHTSTDAIFYAQGGDFRIVNNKILGSRYGLRVWLEAGGTGTLLLTGNSFEEQRTNGIRIAQRAARKNLGNVAIVGNQFSIIKPRAPQSSIAVAAGTAGNGAPSWIKNIAIVGNVFNNAHNAPYPIISLRDGTAITIAANALNANGQAQPLGIDVGGNAVKAQVTGNDVVGVTGGNEYTPSAIRFKTPTATVFFSTGGATVSPGSTVYLTPGGVTATEARALLYIPYSCFALNMMSHAEGAPIGAETFTYTLRVNGMDQAITTKVTGNTTDGQDRTHVVAIPSSAGPSTAQRVSLKLVTSAGAAAVAHTVSVQITGND